MVVDQSTETSFMVLYHLTTGRRKGIGNILRICSFYLIIYLIKITKNDDSEEYSKTVKRILNLLLADKIYTFEKSFTVFMRKKEYINSEHFCAVSQYLPDLDNSLLVIFRITSHNYII